MASVPGIPRHRLRLIGGVLVLTTMVGVLWAAPRLAGDLGMAGLNDEQVRVVGHFMAYGSLAAVLALSLGGRFVTSWFIMALFAGADEIAQHFIPGRYAGMPDWLVDIAGITVFLTITATAWIFSGQADPEPASS